MLPKAHPSVIFLLVNTMSFHSDRVINNLGAYTDMHVLISVGKGNFKELASYLGVRWPVAGV